MVKRKIPLIGSCIADVNESVNKLATQATQREAVAEYDVVIGDNIIVHHQRQTPRGHIIVWSECGNLLDISLTSTKWTFSATVAGKVKVIWL